MSVVRSAKLDGITRSSLVYLVRKGSRARQDGARLSLRLRQPPQVFMV